MPKTTPEYVRIYQSVVDDPKFATVYDDDHHFATWVRLLMAADALWPASCPIPANTRKASLTALCDAGLVALGTGSRFRITGLDKERNARSESGRNAAAMRWQSDRIPQPDADPMQAKPSRAEPSRAEPTAAHDPWDDPEHEALVWLAKHGCDVRPGNGYHRKLVTAVEVHGVNALVGMMDRLADAGTKHGDVKGFLFGAIDALDARDRPSLNELMKADRGQDERRAHQARLERTRRETAQMREALIETER